MVMGSPHYMSPEQLHSSSNVDARSDIWSLGATLYELLSGNKPFQAPSVPALCARIQRDTPVPLHELRSDVPPALEAVVARCLEKDPRRRYPSVAGLARALASLSDHSSAASLAIFARVAALPPASVAGMTMRVSDTTTRRFPQISGAARVAMFLAAAGVAAVVGATSARLSVSSAEASRPSLGGASLSPAHVAAPLVAASARDAGAFERSSSVARGLSARPPSRLPRRRLSRRARACS